MKSLCLLLSLILINPKLENSFYDFEFEDINGTIINTSVYPGERVVVAVISSNEAGRKLVNYFDSIQKAGIAVQVIAIPTDEFNVDVNLDTLGGFTTNSHIVVAKPLKIKKSNAELQHPLFAWLTNVTKNNHFDMDVEREGQLFIISEKGTLYSVLPDLPPTTELNKILTQPFAE